MGYFSNGTEGMDYEAQWCARCRHHAPDEGGCAVWLAHLLHNYEECNRPDSILHLLIPRGPQGENQPCRMFLEQV